MPITGSSTSTFTTLTQCKPGDCAIVSTAKFQQVQWGSTSYASLANPSTLTAASSLAFDGTTDTTLTIGKLTWFNSSTLASRTDPNFKVDWNLKVAFSAPAGATGDTQIFALDITSPANPAADHINNLTLADLASLSFSIPGVTASNFKYILTDGSTSSLACTSGNCDWSNNEKHVSTLTITADFMANAVPEPASPAAIGLGLIATGALARRRRQATMTPAT